MKQSHIFELFNIEDLNDLPEAVTKVILLDAEERDTLYEQLLSYNNGDLSFDWFQQIYEEELSQRNQNKQDFTPQSVCALLSELTGNVPGRIYEPTAGNGSLLIANWQHRRSHPDYSASDHPVECWELSARSIPILLFNLSIRGIEGTVYHGDVLTKEIRNKYILKNNGKFSIIEKT